MDLKEQYDNIYRYCHMKTGHPETAEDLTQETFLRFLEDTGYQEQGRQLAYLYTIARNLCMDYFRRNKICRWRTEGCPVRRAKAGRHLWPLMRAEKRQEKTG